MKWLQQFKELLAFGGVCVAAVLFVYATVDTKSDGATKGLKEQIDREAALREQVINAKIEGSAIAQNAKFDAINSRLDRFREVQKEMNEKLDKVLADPRRQRGLSLLPGSEKGGS